MFNIKQQQIETLDTYEAIIICPNCNERYEAEDHCEEDEIICGVCGHKGQFEFDTGRPVVEITLLQLWFLGIVLKREIVWYKKKDERTA